MDNHAVKATQQDDHPPNNCLCAHLLVQAIGNCRGSGLVDDAHHLQASNHTSILQDTAI